MTHRSLRDIVLALPALKWIYGTNLGIITGGCIMQSCLHNSSNDVTNLKVPGKGGTYAVIVHIAVVSPAVAHCHSHQDRQ